MKTGTRLLILCLLAPAALAENMSLRSGRVLKDAVVVSSGDDFVNIQYTDGVAKVSYKDLTDAQQRDYRMTPDEVKARLDQRRMEEAARRKKAEEARKAADEEARKIRESLSEAERHPRYLEGADISRMFFADGGTYQGGGGGYGSAVECPGSGPCGFAGRRPRFPRKGGSLSGADKRHP